MNEDEVARWLKASHNIIRLFWPGHSEYSLALKWVGEWFCSGEFLVTQEDRKKLDVMTMELQPGFDSGQISCLLAQLREGDQKDVGLAFMPYLFYWNIQRFKEYFKRNAAFSLDHYCQTLGNFVTIKKPQINEFYKKRILHDEVDDSVDSIIDLMNDELRRIGISQNEPVGTAKLLHILAPHFFPLVDNAIAEVMLLKQRGQTLTTAAYKRWIERVKDWLLKHQAACTETEEQLGVPILKLLDEGLYLMCTVHRELPKKATSELGL